jgi:sulfur carrier protein ThiS adenylyltransferase
MNSFEQGLLHNMTRHQLKRIQKIRIGLGGAGGLGSNVALALVRSGFKSFEIIDYDRIETNNLNRQQYFLPEVGQPKALVLKKQLLNVNPDAEITIHAKKWALKTAARYFLHCDFIIEAFDQATTKRAFVEYYQDKSRAVISGNGIAGKDIMALLKVKRIGNIYFVGDRMTAASRRHPPSAPQVMACAALMASIVLDLSLNRDNV